MRKSTVGSKRPNRRNLAVFWAAQAAAISVAGMLSPGHAQGATYTWTGATDATWGDANWSPAVAPGASDAALFNNAGNGNTTLSLGSGTTIGAITFDTNAAAYTIGAGAVGSQTLTLGDAGSITMTSAVANNELFDATLVLGTDDTAQTYTVANNSANTLTFASNITGGPAVGSAGIATLNVGGTGATVISGSLINGSASTLALTKTGTGTLTFNGTTNAATLGSGTTGGAFGQVTISSGNLTLDFSNFNGAGNANLLNSFTPVALAGGTLQIIGNAGNASTQSFTSSSGVTSNPGLNTITVGPHAGNLSDPLPTLNLGTFTQNIGSEAVFYGPAYYNGASIQGVTTTYTSNVAATGTITTSTVGTGANLLWPAGRTGMSTVGLYNWASVSTSAGTKTIYSGDQVSGFYTQVLSGGTAGNFDLNYDLLGNAKVADVGGSGSYKNDSYLDTIRFNVPGAFTFTTALGGGTSGISEVGGILVTPNVGANNTTIASGGAYISPEAGGNPSAMDVFQNNTQGELVFNVNFYNPWNGSNFTSDAGCFVFGGPGTVVLTGQGTSDGQTGSTYLNGGNTVISDNSQLGKASTNAALYLNGGTAVGSLSTSLSLATRAVTLLGNGGGLASVAGGTMTVGGVISGAAGTGPLVIGIPASLANSNTPGLLPGTGANTANTAGANGGAVYGTGAVVLTGSNTYAGGTTVTAGATANINGIDALGGSNTVTGWGGVTLNNGTLQYAATSTNGTTDLSTGPGLTIGSGGATIDVNHNAVTYANSIGHGGAGGLTVNSTTAGGVLTLSSGSSFTGGLTVGPGAGLVANGANAFSSASLSGTLTTNSTTSLGNIPIAVNSGGTWNAYTGAGNFRVGTTGASLSLLGGGTLSMVDGSIGTLSLNSPGSGAVNNVLTLPATSTSASLNLELGSTGADQIIANNGLAAISGGGAGGLVNISLTDLGSVAPSSLTGIPLITVPNGTLSASNFHLLNTTANFGANNYTLSLGLVGTDELVLNLTAASLLDYWKGGTSGSWLTAGNFATDHTGATLQTSLPGSTNSVFETVDAPSGNYAQTLGGNTNINALVFTGTGTGAAANSVTIASGGSGNYTLTLTPSIAVTDPVSLIQYAAGTGIEVEPGSAAHTVSANVVLGGSQTWEIDNSPANALTVSGSISDGGNGYGLTKTGTGGLILSNANTYGGLTTVSNGVLTAANDAALGSSTASGTGLLLSPGAGSISTVNFTSANPAIASLASSGAGTSNIVLGNTSGSGSATTLTVGGNNVATTFAGTISDGTGTIATAIGGLTKVGSGTLALTGSNTYTGVTNINAGVLSINNSNALGSGVAGNTIGINNATLESTTGAIALTANQSVALTGTGTLQVDAGTLTINGIVSGSTANLTKTGAAGYLVLANAGNTYGGTTSINSGTVQFSASGNLGNASSTNTLSFNGGTLELLAGNSVDLNTNRSIALVGAGALSPDAGSSILVDGAISGTGTLTVGGAGSVTLTNGNDTFSNLVIANGSTLNIAGANVTLSNATEGSPYASYQAGGNNSVVYLSSGSLTYANDGAAGNDPNEALLGTFTQTGGTVTTEATNMAGFLGQTFQLYIGGNASCISNAGKFSSFTVGTRGLANAFVSGNASLAVNGTTYPMWVGAQYTGGNTGLRTFVQQDNATVTTNGLTLGGANGTNGAGAYYLSGGTLTTGSLNRGYDANATGGAGTLYFGGGTFATNATSVTTDANVSTVVNAGGGTINLGAGNITWSGAITQGTTGNVTLPSIANAGSGYTSAPTVTITGTGTGATATAIINAQGQVVDVVITNPGSGYTSTPTFTFSAPTSGTTALANGNAPLTGVGSLVVNGEAQGQNILGFSGNSSLTGGLYVENGAQVQLETAAGNFGGSTDPLILLSGSGAARYSYADLAGFSVTTGPLSGNANSQIFNDEAIASNASTLTVNTVGTSIYAGNIGGGPNGTTNDTLNLSTIGNGSLVLTGNNTYSGTTNIGGTSTLVVGSGGNLIGSGVTVTSGATLLAQQGNAGISTGVSLASGSTISQVDGKIGSLNITSGGLTIGGTTAANLDFELNDSVSGGFGQADVINVSGSLAYGTAGGKIFLTALGGGSAPASGTKYTLITDSNGGLGSSGTFSLGQATLSLDSQTYILNLAQSTTTAEIVQLTLSTGTYNDYWTGHSSASWSAIGNFGSDSTGLTTASALPGIASNVFETANAAQGSNPVANYTQTLDSAVSVNSLTFTGTGTPAASQAVTIGPGTGGSLTLNAALPYTDTTGTYTGVGLLVEAGSAAGTISANVALGNSQTWELDSSAGTLTVSGNVTDGSNGPATLTKTGIGELVLSGSNSYSGGTTISGGTLLMGSASALPTATGLLTVNGGTLDLGGHSLYTTSLSDGGVSTGLITSSSGTPTFTLANATAGTFSGSIGGSLALTLSGSSSVTLSGSNTYSGLTTLSSGTLVAASNSALGNSTSATGGLSMSGTSVADFTSASPAIASLAGGAGNGIVLGSTSGTATTLTVGGGGQSTTFAGIISDLSATSATAIGNLTVSGGTLALSGANTFTGTTAISGGTLLLANSAALQDSTLNYNNPAGNLSFGALTAATLAGLTGGQNLALVNASSGSVTLSVGNNNVSSTYTGILSGSGALNKIGSGTVVIGSGILGGADYTGPTTVTTGALQLGGVGVSNEGSNPITLIGTGAATLTITDSAQVTTSGEITITSDLAYGIGYPSAVNLQVLSSGQLTVGGLQFGDGATGAGARTPLGTGVTIGGSGVLTVNGNFDLNNTDGGTVQASNNQVNLNGGTLAVDAFIDLNATATHQATIHFNGGVLEALASDPTPGSVFFLPAQTTVAALTADVDGGGAIINTNGFNDTISQVLAHGTVGVTATTDGGLTKNGAGILTLASTGNSYFGTTTVNAGVLNINSEYALGGANYGGLTLNGGTLQFASTLLNATVDLTANSGGTAKPLSIGAGGGTIDTNGNTVSFAHPITGTGTFTYADSNATPGELTLAGSSTYSGATNVAGGTLNVTGALANSGTVTLTGSSNLVLAGANALPSTAIVNVGANANAYVNAGQTLASISNAGNATFSTGTSIIGQGNGTGTGAGGSSTTGGISGSGTLTVNGSGTLYASHITQAMLNIGSSSTVTIADSAAPSNNASVSVLTDLSNSGTLDLKNNDMIVNDASQYATVKAQIINAQNGGNWNQPGITSSSAAANHLTGLGYGQVGTGSGQLNVSSFDGQPVSSGATLVKYTLYGDLLLTGSVTATDFNIILPNYNKAVTGGWSQGDLFGTGQVTAADFNAMLPNYNKSDSTLSPSVLVSPALSVAKTSAVSRSLSVSPALTLYSWDAQLPNAQNGQVVLKVDDVTTDSNYGDVILQGNNVTIDSLHITSASGKLQASTTDTKSHYNSFADQSAGTDQSTDSGGHWSLINATTTDVYEAGIDHEVLTFTSNAESYDMGKGTTVAKTSAPAWGVSSAHQLFVGLAGDLTATYGDLQGNTDPITVEYFSSTQSTPEPASLGLLALGGVMMMRRRRSNRNS